MDVFRKLCMDVTVHYILPSSSNLEHEFEETGYIFRGSNSAIFIYLPFQWGQLLKEALFGRATLPRRANKKSQRMLF